VTLSQQKRELKKECEFERGGTNGLDRLSFAEEIVENFFVAFTSAAKPSRGNSRPSREDRGLNHEQYRKRDRSPGAGLEIIFCNSRGDRRSVQGLSR
jgi:hypothetical protein